MAEVSQLQAMTVPRHMLLNHTGATLYGEAVRASRVGPDRIHINSQRHSPRFGFPSLDRHNDPKEAASFAKLEETSNSKVHVPAASSKCNRNKPPATIKSEFLAPVL